MCSRRHWVADISASMVVELGRDIPTVLALYECQVSRARYMKSTLLRSACVREFLGL